MTSPTIWLNEFLPVNGDLVQQYSLIVPSILSNKINAASPIYIRATGLASLLKLNVNQPAQGNAINISIYQGNTLWTSGALAIGAKEVILSTFGLAQLVIGNIWRVDITQVGGIYPGSNLVVTIVV